MKQNLNRSDLFNAWRERIAIAKAIAINKFSAVYWICNGAGPIDFGGWFFGPHKRAANDNEARS